MASSLVILSVGALIFLAHLFSAIFDKTRIPDVLPLVLLGLLFGPILGFIQPEDFGKVGGVFGTIALVLILFESGLGLDLKSLRHSMGRGLGLTLANFAVTLAAVSLLSHFLYGFGWASSLLMGAILGGISPAVVIPLVRKLALAEDIKTALLLESSFSDVLCIVVALALENAFQAQQMQPLALVGGILASFLLSGLLGAAAGLGWSALLTHVRRLENSTLATPAFVFIVYGLAEVLGFSGGIAALAFGVTLGNIARLDGAWLRRLGRFTPIQLNPTEKTLLSEGVFLLKTFFFVYIGLNIQTRSLQDAAIGLALTLALFALRVPVVYLCLSKQESRFDASLVAVMVPRGLAAAVLASIPLNMNLPEGAQVKEVVYAVILVSILLTAILSFLIEKTPFRAVYGRMFLGYRDPDAAEEPTPALGLNEVEKGP